MLNGVIKLLFFLCWLNIFFSFLFGSFFILFNWKLTMCYILNEVSYDMMILNHHNEINRKLFKNFNLNITLFKFKNLKEKLKSKNVWKFKIGGSILWVIKNKVAKFIIKSIYKKK